MTSHRAELTPHMLKYAEKFDDRGEIRWLPYLMYFHPADHVSEVVNTDSLGFRISHRATERASLGGHLPEGPVRLLAGSSTVFGIGATCDQATLSSRLWATYAPSQPWLNFGARSHNSTQELLLFVLNRHLLPQVSEIVLFSGFNNLGLARLPDRYRGEHGAFFNCGQYFGKMDELVGEHRRKSVFGLGGGRRTQTPPTASSVLDLPEQIAYATDLTVRHLDVWRLLAEGMGARLTYVLQPLATWVRDEPAPQEKLLFGELDQISNFRQAYGDIADLEAGRAYAAALREGCERIGVRFVDFNPVLADAVGPQDWLFVDRIHFTDEGHDIVAGLLAKTLELN